MDDSQRKLAAEFVGTFALIFFGAGSALQGADVVGQALANGLAIGLMVTAVGHISGGHFNPAVTLSMLVTGRIEPGEAVRYWICQLAGAVAAALVLLAVFPSAITDAANLGVPAVGGHGISTVNALDGRDRRHVLPRLRHLRRRGRQARCVPASSRACPIGLTISIGVLAVGGVSGAAFNPARWFGPALVSGSFDNFWIWIVGPGDRRCARGPRLRPAAAQGHSGGVGSSTRTDTVWWDGAAVPPHGCNGRDGGMSGESSVRELRATGLQGVSLGETEIALVDGENGRLIYRGHDAERLAHESTLRGHGIPALERAPARRRRALRPQPPRGGRDGRARRGARGDPLGRPGRAADGRPAHRPLGLGRAAGTRRGRRQRGRPVGARRNAGDRRRLRAHSARAPSRSRPIPSSGSSRTTCSSSAASCPDAGAGPRARRVLHPRRRARHERVDVHRARDRLDALRSRLGPGRRGRRPQGAAARRRAEPRLAHDRRDRHGRERRALAAPQARCAARC